jgi:hypothetical protein
VPSGRAIESVSLPEDVFLAPERDADRGVDGPVGDLPVADFHHDRVDEHRSVDLIERPGLPGLHLLDDPGR